MSSNTPLPSSFDGDSEFYEENRLQKLTRRLKEEPLIPVGCLLTCAALLGATRSIRAGDHNRTNRMFRARIYAQGFTLVAMVVGSMYWQTDRQKRKEFDSVVAERKAKEKNEAWIRELEARDEEEKAMRARRDAYRARTAAATPTNSSNFASPPKPSAAAIPPLPPSPPKPSDPPSVASSMIDDRERRRGTLELVTELVYRRQ